MTQAIWELGTEHGYALFIISKRGRTCSAMLQMEGKAVAYGLKVKVTQTPGFAILSGKRIILRFDGYLELLLWLSAVGVAGHTSARGSGSG